ncbi:MAG: hypothetical protein IT566_10635 [Rhodospirillaceae bacterium]|nr:hypothetical protein [Rhodospirillaceae bacterium]
MLRVLILVCLVIFSFPKPLYAQLSAKHFEYVSAGMTAVMNAQLKGPRLSASEFTDAMTIACQAMLKLEGDKEFERLLRSQKRADAEARAILLGNLAQFRDFLLFERQVMIDNGLSEAMATQLAIEIASYAKPAASSKIPPDQLLRDLGRVRQATCTASEQAATSLKAEERWAIAYRVGQGVIGTGIVVFNVAALTASSGVSTASVLVGGAIVQDAISK